MKFTRKELGAHLACSSNDLVKDLCTDLIEAHNENAHTAKLNEAYVFSFIALSEFLSENGKPTKPIDAIKNACDYIRELKNTNNRLGFKTRQARRSR